MGVGAAYGALQRENVALRVELTERDFEIGQLYTLATRVAEKRRVQT